MTGVDVLLKALNRYQLQWPWETKITCRYTELLTHPEAFQRTHLPGHLTGSAFIINEEATHTLLVHHGKLNRWLQPGGHADGSMDIEGVARREATEETGVRELNLVRPTIYDLDIHAIPARGDFPAHDHYDIRYLYRTSMQLPLVVSEESHDVQWIRLQDLEKFNNEVSLLRLREKLSI